MSKSGSIIADSKTSTELKAITINGAITVESEEDLKRREERRKKRKSRWGSSQEATNATSGSGVPPAAKRSSIVIPGVPDAPPAVAPKPSSMALALRTPHGQDK